MEEQYGGWKSARKSVDKGLLKNIIRHTDAHNKIQEQNEMWKQWELKKQTRKQNQVQKLDRRTSGFMRSDVERNMAKKESLKWNRLLLEYEEARNDRWGHSGYKELYPEEFEEKNSEDELSNTNHGDVPLSAGVEDTPSTRKKKGGREKTSKRSRKRSSVSSDDDIKRHKKKRSFRNKLNSRSQSWEVQSDADVDRPSRKELADPVDLNNRLSNGDGDRKYQSDSDRRGKKRKSEYISAEFSRKHSRTMRHDSNENDSFSERCRATSEKKSTSRKRSQKVRH